LTSIAKSSGVDIQTAMLKSAWLEYLGYNNSEAYYIASEYAFRHLQHLRRQLEWRVE
jgi:hypothetical protein